MATPDTRPFRSQAQARAQGRCEYCRLPEAADFASFEVDHVIATQPCNMGGNGVRKSCVWLF